MLYKAALRAELSTSLGVRWTAVDDNGIAEIEGVPEVLVEQWSTRRKAVEEMGSQLAAEREAKLGRELSASERATAFQLAAYRTRAPKVESDTPTAELTARWREEARAWGQDPELWLSHVIDREPPQLTANSGAAVAATIERLQATKATFGRSDAVEVLSTLVSGERAEEVRTIVDRLADEVLRADAVCSLAAPLPADPPQSLRRRDGMAQIERHGATRFTTTATLRAEGRVLETVAKGTHARAAMVPTRTIDAVLGRSNLGEDQRRAVTDLLTGGERAALLVGPAGAGKSRALDAARAGWEHASYRLVGVAPSAMAASVLHEEAGIASDTLARFLLDVQHGQRRLGDRDVVVLDEATMARTDDLDRLLGEVVRANAKLVLVGDPNQLGAVGPGGLFATLVGHHRAAELETVRRFHNTWEAAASLRLRERDVSVLALYAEHGRIGGGNRHTAMEDAFAAWREAREHGRSVLVMAGDNATADAFATRARAERVGWGEVEEHGARLANGIAGVGDEIVTLKNNRRLVPAPGEFVRNGERWRVVGRHGDGSLSVEATSGHGSVILPASYVREHVALSYALTVHKAQGQTVDEAIVLVDEQMSAQQLYVAMSRGRDANRAFVVHAQGELSEHAFANFKDPTPYEVLADVMRRDGAERSAHDVMRQALDRMDDLDLLRHLHTEANRRIDEKAGHDRSKEIERLAAKADLARARADLQAAHEHVRDATRRRELAEERIIEHGARPARALLPGRLGEDARREADDTAHRADAELRTARVAEQRALQDAERARHALYEAERATDEIDRLREAQHRRVEWLRAHPDEERYVVQLEARIAAADRAIRSIEDEQDRNEAHHERPTESGTRRPAPERTPRPLWQRRPLGERDPDERDRNPAEQAVIDHTPRRLLERKLAAEEARSNPQRWRSAAELERRAAVIEKELAGTLAQLERNQQRAQVDPATRAGELAIDRRAIAQARDDAAWHRSAARAWEDHGEKLVEQARADYLAAREASAVITEGPGRLHFRAGAVAQARERLYEIEGRWPGRQLPGHLWSDQTVNDASANAACSSVRAEVRAHLADAERLEQEAAVREQRMRQRELIYDGKERQSARYPEAVEDAHEHARGERGELAKERRHREELAEGMTPEEIAKADRSRDAWLERREEQRQELLLRERTKSIEHQPPAPHVARPVPNSVLGGREGQLKPNR
jgi:hypothetical protein